MHTFFQILSPSVFLPLLLLLFTAHSTCSPLWWDFPGSEGTSAVATGTLSPPHRVVRARSPANTNVNPDAVTGTTCDDASVDLVTHDTNVALLAICGSIAGSIQFCEGDPATTVGASGTSKFTLTAVNADQGATINVSKGRWEGCIRAARATCPTGTFTSTCVGGTSDGAGFTFVLSENN
ncbi:hypothetical protein A1O7_00639 [Cladophialophora yegresii CBS 114405]|uniref:Uncharacterized protein n=1 Tax=Cladophialophora yegresii CBS 114405 TaxID=1182544 RepID=W9W8J8_9EURO|nr:uncharacterized protein A1O7_00639 [Cladophialophora yegresii CBS 114405]EXJ64303.1 hypothetical protein A1O7_00639 [Cladophialophora yegresii CBS 114405]